MTNQEGFMTIYSFTDKSDFEFPLAIRKTKLQTVFKVMSLEQKVWCKL